MPAFLLPIAFSNLYEGLIDIQFLELLQFPCFGVLGEEIWH